MPGMQWLGAANSVACEIKPSLYVYSTHLLYPTPDYITSSQNPLFNDDNHTVIALNVFNPKSFRSCALNHFSTSTNFAGALLTLKTGNTTADFGTTQMFAMDGTPVINKRVTSNPLTVSLADGRQVLSTHMCDIYIEGLPFLLTGHIIPELSITFYAAYAF
jgi:hypothetical protein